MKKLTTTLFALITLFASTTVGAQTLLHTGIDNDADTLSDGDSDPRWKIDGSAAEVSDTRGGWVGDNGTSKWLELDDEQTVSIEFDMTPAEAASGRIDGRLSADDYILAIYLNGSELNVPNRINSGNDKAWERWTDFSVENGFEAGTNVLRFVVLDTGGPGGFRAELELTTSSGFDFNDACVPKENHDLQPLTPNATIMLDASDAMGEDSGFDLDGDMTNETWMELAAAAIADLAVWNHLPGSCITFDPSTCDPVRLGIGYHADPLSGLIGLESQIAVMPNEDASPVVASNAQGMMTGGDTNLAAAIDAFNSSESPGQEDVAVIISSGPPNADGDVRRAIDAACDARSRGDTVHVIGFGPYVAPGVNSAVAAAGGSGVCCENGTAAPCTGSDRIDPCSAGASAIAQQDNSLAGGISCSGSPTTNVNTLKDAIVDKLQEGECVFDLDIPSGYPDGKAFEDPAGTRVRIKLPYVATGYVDLPNAGDDTRDLADELEAAYGGGGGGMSVGGGADAGSTDAGPDAAMDASAAADAAMDASAAADAAMDASADAGADGGMGGGTPPPPSPWAKFADEGWEFTNSDRDEIRLTDNLCRLVRSRELTAVDTQLACTCTKAGANCSFTLSSEFLSFTTYQLERLRCTEGVFECRNGRDSCSGTANALPEICNGFDDDCDGVVDNMASSEPEWQDYIDNGVDPEGLHCGFVNTCGCDEPGYYDEPSSGIDIEDHKDSWTGRCECSESLSPDFSFAPPSPAQPTEPGSDSVAPVDDSQDAKAAGCATGGPGGSSATLLVLFGLFLLGRRRRA